MEDSIAVITSEIEGRLEVLESNLPRHLNGFALCAASKLPFKALSYRETLAWRMAEVARAAFEHFQDGRLVAAILLTRAAVETTAALGFLRAKLDAAIRAASVEGVDDDLMKLVMGGRVDQDILLPAFNVLSFVDRADKRIPGFREFGVLLDM